MSIKYVKASKDIYFVEVDGERLGTVEKRKVIPTVPRGTPRSSTIRWVANETDDRFRVTSDTRADAAELLIAEIGWFQKNGTGISS